MQLTNHTKLPQPLINAIANDDYDPGNADISVTSLISPPQKVALEKKHSDMLTQDVADGIYALIGKSIHKILEDADESAIKEERLYTYSKGWCISGQFDRLVLNENNVLQDYKVSSVWEYIYGLKPEREQQLNCYAELIRANYDESKWPTLAEIIFIFRDWSKSKAKFTEGYPKHQVAIMSVPLWTQPKTQDFIDHRVSLHQAAQSGKKILCSDEDRWKDPTKWAVMKPGRKNAVKLHENYENAVAHIDKDDSLELFIEKRPSIAKRCEDYCHAAPFCTQFQNEKKDEAVQ